MKRGFALILPVVAISLFAFFLGPESPDPARSFPLQAKRSWQVQAQNALSTHDVIRTDQLHSTKTGETPSTDMVIPEAALMAFRHWLSKQTGVIDSSRFPEGLTLLKKRRVAMAKMIKENPRDAMAGALDFAEREKIPKDWQPWLEDRFSTVAKLDVIPDCSSTEGSALLFLKREGHPVVRGRLWGKLAGFQSKRHLPVEGVELDGHFALAEEGIRRLTGAEQIAAAKLFPHKGSHRALAPSSAVPTWLMGGKLFQFVDTRAALELQQAHIQIAAMPGPAAADGLARIMDETELPPAEEILREARAVSNYWTTSPKSVLVLNTVFPDRNTPVETQAALQARMTEVSAWISMDSYGKTSLTATVLPTVFTLPSPVSTYQPTEDFFQLMSDAKDLANTAGYNPDKYDITVVIFPEVDWNWSGRATLGGGDHWLNGTMRAGTVAHEFGHNYGLNHAKSWEANDGSVMPPYGSISSAASEMEYGDIFSVMGSSGSYPDGDFGPQAKTQLRWINNSQVEKVIEPGVYRIHRFDSPTANMNPTLALKLQREDSETFWIGYRRNFTDNSQLSNGAYITWEYDPNHCRLLDMTPDSHPGDNYQDKLDVALGIGQSFVTPGGFFHIKPVAQGGTAPNEWLDVEVKLLADGNHLPLASMDLAEQGFQARQPIDFSATATDADGDPLFYRWDFGNGQTSTESKVIWTFVTGGPRTVTLRVNDGRGGIARISKTILVDEPLLFWSNVTRKSLDNAHLAAVAANAKRFVVVGGLGAASATVGTVGVKEAWTLTNMPISARSVAVGPLGFVAVGTYYDSRKWRSAAAFSPDGSAWKTRKILSGSGLDCVVSSGSAFVAVGDGGMFRSTDGNNWKRISLGTSGTLSSVAFSGSVGLAVGNGKIFLSEDAGLIWKDVSSTLGGVFYPNTVFSAEGRFFLGEYGRMRVYDPVTKLANEAEVKGGEFGFLESVVKHGSTHVALAGEVSGTSDGLKMLLVSTDGLNWEILKTSWMGFGFCLANSGSRLVAAGDTGILVNQVLAAAPSNIYKDRFTANWSKVPGTTEYRLDVSTNSSFSSFLNGYQNRNVGLNVKRQIMKLRPNTTYYYRVRAVMENVVSANSQTVKIRTLANPPRGKEPAAFMLALGESISANPATNTRSKSSKSVRGGLAGGRESPPLSCTNQAASPLEATVEMADASRIHVIHVDCDEQGTKVLFEYQQPVNGRELAGGDFLVEWSENLEEWFPETMEILNSVCEKNANGNATTRVLATCPLPAIPCFVRVSFVTRE